MKNTSTINKVKVPWLILFGAAMGILEAIVVVYVRELYYPNGFHFPLKILPPNIVLIELVRELCTLVMLFSVAFLVVKPYLRRFSIFILLFGVWDIMYYIGLKLFLNWPESFFTWDILFLIPITWIGPVLAPIICSVVMICMGLLFEYYYRLKKISKLRWIELLFIISGAFVILYTFIYDFGKLILEGDFSPKILSLAENTEFLKLMASYIPSHFQWGLFSLGIGLNIIGLLVITRRIIK